MVSNFQTLVLSVVAGQTRTEELRKLENGALGLCCPASIGSHWCMAFVLYQGSPSRAAFRHVFECENR